MEILSDKHGQGMNFMNDRFFLDSNVLIYSIDNGEVIKQQIANNIIATLSEKGGVISTQVLQEFYNIATKKLGITKQDAKLLLERLSECFLVHNNTVSDILHAIEISIKTQFSFWDSLIISAALAEGCSMLYSEDLNDGQIVEGIVIKNPMKK